jgi:hypothetical protein
MIGGNIMGTVGNKQPFTFGLRGVAAVNREFFCPALSQDAVGALSEEERVALYGRGRPYLAAAIGVRRALTNGPWTAVTRWRLVGALSEAFAEALREWMKEPAGGLLELQRAASILKPFRMLTALTDADSADLESLDSVLEILCADAGWRR